MVRQAEFRLDFAKGPRCTRRHTNPWPSRRAQRCRSAATDQTGDQRVRRSSMSRRNGCRRRVAKSTALGNAPEAPTMAAPTLHHTKTSPLSRPINPTNTTSPHFHRCGCGRGGDVPLRRKVTVRLSAEAEPHIECRPHCSGISANAAIIPQRSRGSTLGSQTPDTPEQTLLRGSRCFKT